MNDGNTYDMFFWLNVIANLAQLESYQLLLKDATNNELMNELQQQDKVLSEQTNDYLKKIVEQNEYIIEQNKEILAKLK